METEILCSLPFKPGLIFSLQFEVHRAQEAQAAPKNCVKKLMLR